MKNRLIFFFLFISLSIQFSGIAQTEDPRKVFNREKIYLTEGQEQLALNLANSTVFQKREALLQEIEKSSLERIIKNKISNPTFNQRAQEIFNDKSLSSTQKNEVLKKLGMVGDKEDGSKMKQLVEINKDLIAEFPILKQLDKDTKGRIYTRSFQLISQKRGL